ncbi:hypothetical protein ANN_05296 [Periplaneta americana]|uniref:Uncharacterized protein n=1 Tax=Periplaneta americana TaxID=6978 RepID=A0ABQ8TAQ6_PERAM|nr:hypothetical protein ANN_05296 [Periplaneta americana]
MRSSAQEIEPINGESASFLVSRAGATAVGSSRSGQMLTDILYLLDEKIGESCLYCTSTQATARFFTSLYAKNLEVLEFQHERNPAPACLFNDARNCRGYISVAAVPEFCPTGVLLHASTAELLFIMRRLWIEFGPPEWKTKTLSAKDEAV